MVDQQMMRASDRDRQQVVERLRSALEDGRLTMEEYVNRMEVAPRSPRSRRASPDRPACGRSRLSTTEAETRCTPAADSRRSTV